MKTVLTNSWKRMLVSCVVVFVAIPAGVLLSRSLDWRRDYIEAEPLEGPISNLAICMSEFTEKHGRPPNSIDEVAGSLRSQDYSRLKRYPHEFTATGATRFYLRVNRHFAFSVTEDFSPHFVQLSGFLEKPQSSK